MKRARRRRRSHEEPRPTHRLFSEAFYENLHAMMDKQIAEMMKDAAFRKWSYESNVRMFELMVQIARKEMARHR